MQRACAILSSVAWPAQQNFSTLSHKWHDFRKTSLNIICVIRAFVQLLSETFFIVRRPERDMIETILVFMQSALYSCPILMKLKFSQQSIRKYSNIKFDENPSHGSRVVPCGRTDMMKLIVAFRNFANAPKNIMFIEFSFIWLSNLKFV